MAHGMKPKGRYYPGNREYFTPKPPSEQDKFQVEATAAAKDAVVKQLKRFIETNRDRRIRELVDKELECVAIGAISAWCLKRAEQEDAAKKLDDSVEDIFA